MWDSIGALKLTEILRPKLMGEPVNNHILPAVRELAPDYEAMNRLVSTPHKGPVSVDGKTEGTPGKRTG